MDENYDAHVDTAVAAADAARAVTMRHFRTALTVADKSDRSPRTVADIETEQTIRAVIQSRHPRHEFFGEEGGFAVSAAAENSSRGGPTARGEWRWVIDPIDGTKAFATGNPTFGTLIALLHHGRPRLGVIDHPALDERWVGVHGRGTLHNGAPCAAAATRNLSEATLYATTPDMFTLAERAQFDKLSAALRFRVFGGDCYAYGLLARGFVDVVCEAGLHAHDYLALMPVVQGAGGVITDWRGQALRAELDAPGAGQAPNAGQVLAAGNAVLHRAAVAALAAAA